MLYHVYQWQSDALAPLRLAAEWSAGMLSGLSRGESPNGPQIQQAPLLWNSIAAACEVFSAARLTHSRPPFGIQSVRVPGHRDPVPVSEEVVARLPFGTLLRFKREGVGPQPRVLVVAPMSGHFATLLRDTVRTMLGDHDVYITDWHNARDVPLSEGRFGLSEYTDHVIRFLEIMGPGSHVLAICQPCVSTLSAAAVMAEDDNPAQPLTMTLMAGPIDCRINPTEVNRLAVERPIEWFRNNMISSVPARHQGAYRKVYPGFVQLMAFMQMNPDRHQTAFKNIYRDLRDGHDERARSTLSFYEEYFAVLDLTAEFYLETVEQVFQTYDLPRGVLRWHDRTVNPAAVRRTALMTVEGERDDVCSIGQTVAAHDLCSQIPPFRKQHHVQTGVGHYGVFSGSRWQKGIYPRVREMIHAHDQG